MMSERTRKSQAVEEKQTLLAGNLSWSGVPRFPVGREQSFPSLMGILIAGDTAPCLFKKNCIYEEVKHNSFRMRNCGVGGAC